MTQGSPRIVAIVGTGLIGRAWAAVFARAGWTVRLYDPDPATQARSLALVADELAMLAGHGLCEDPTGAAARVSAAASLAEAVADAGFVQENGPETLERKLEIFAALDRLAPADAILASSTSAIVASHFTADLAGRGRCLVGHPVNPPHLVPLVELCAAPWTRPQVMQAAHAIYAQIGQVPVTVHREIEGFVLNRLQGAVLAEAFRLVAEGVMTPQDLDHTIKDGLGLRWSFMGPFETIELNAPGGLADYCDRYMGIYRRLAADPAGPQVYDAPAIDRVKQAWTAPATPDRLARRARWRNDRLAALATHKRGQPDAP